MSGENGGFTGYGSVFGVLDAQREIVDQGAYTRTLARFRKAGLITWMHDQARPVAMPVEVREDPVGLYLKCDFHSHPDGQAARAIVTERLAAGLDVGLSIGYRVVADAYVNGIRHLTDVELYEVAIVSVPANYLALATTAKGLHIGQPVPLKSGAVVGGAVAATDKAAAKRRHEMRVLMLTGEARSLGVRV